MLSRKICDVDSSGGNAWEIYVAETTKETDLAVDAIHQIRACEVNIPVAVRPTQNTDAQNKLHSPVRTPAVLAT